MEQRQQQRDEQERQSTSTSTMTASESPTMPDEPSTSGSRDPGPLPLKIGELGFVEGVSSTLAAPPMIHRLESTETLSGPHPAERERDANSTRGGVYEHQHQRRQSRHQHANSDASSILPPLPNSSSASLPLVGRRASQREREATAESSTTSLAPSQTSSRSLLKHLTPSPLSKPYLLGGTPRTTLRLFIQLVILGGTIVGWIFAIKDLKAIPLPNNSSDPNNNNSTDNNSNNGASTLSGSGSIFIHVAFTVGVLIQLLFLERCIFLLRAERYMFLHPSSTSLPTHFSSRRNILHLPHSSTDRAGPPRVAYVPWNRPPLPTYAAALGYRGTGDTEDNEIARVFAIGSGEGPPQYGNTRGSTLLAYGIGGARRASVRRGSVGSQISISEREDRPARPERPVSYGHSEQIEDAFRAQKLEMALAKLEAGSSQGH